MASLPCWPTRGPAFTLAARSPANGTYEAVLASESHHQITTPKEGRAIDDLNDLAHLLGVSRRDLRSAIGLPWHRALPSRYDHDFGPLFVGREGSSAAILCLGTDTEVLGAGGLRSRAATRVVVGTATGAWREDGRLGWKVDGSKFSLIRGVGVDPRAFLAGLKAATGRVVAEKAPLLVSCARCQELVGRELCDPDGMCVECTSPLGGIRPTGLQLVAH